MKPLRVGLPCCEKLLRLVMSVHREKPNKCMHPCTIGGRGEGTGWPTCRVGCRRCKMDVRDAKQYRCLHAFSQHAKRQADMQGWQPEMQKKTTYYHVLSRTTTSVVFASRAATLACRPASSRSLLLNCYLLIYCRTSTYYQILPRTTRYYSKY